MTDTASVGANQVAITDDEDRELGRVLLRGSDAISVDSYALAAGQFLAALPCEEVIMFAAESNTGRVDIRHVAGGEFFPLAAGWSLTLQVSNRGLIHAEPSSGTQTLYTITRYTA